MPHKKKRHPGLAKARRVRKLMSEGYSKTEARKKAGVKGAHKKKTKKHAKKKGHKKGAKRRAHR